MEDNDRAIATFTMAGHGLVHWFETAIPILLVVWIAEFDVSLALIGVVVALGYAPFGLGALPAGVLTDRFGSRRIVLVCLGGMSAAFLVIAAASGIVTLAVGLVLWGIAASMYHPAGLALISTGVHNRGTVFAYHGIAGNVGIALGPLTTAALLIWFDWSIVALVLAIPGLIALAFGIKASFDPFAAADETAEADNEPLSIGGFLADSRALFASAFLFVFVLVTFEGLFYRGMLTYLPEIMHDLPTLANLELGAALAGVEPSDFIYVGLLIVGMGGQYVGGRATERFAPPVGLAGLFLILAVLAVVFVPVTALGMGGLLAWAALVGLFLFAIQPFYQEAVAVYTPPAGRGLSYGYTYLGEFGLGAASVAIGGFLLDVYAVGVFFGVLAGFAVVGVALAVLLWGRGTAKTTGSSGGSTSD